MIEYDRICQAVHRYAKGNNKYIKSYEISKVF